MARGTRRPSSPQTRAQTRWPRAWIAGTQWQPVRARLGRAVARELRISPASDMAGAAGDHYRIIWKARLFERGDHVRQLRLLSSKTAMDSYTSSSNWLEHTCESSKSGSAAQKQNRPAEDADPHADRGSSASSSRSITWVSATLRRDPSKQDHLRMPRLLRESARDRHRLIYRQISAQLVLPGPGHFSGSEEVRLVKIFQGDGDLRLVEKARIGARDRLLEAPEASVLRRTSCPRPSGQRSHPVARSDSG